MGNTPAKRGSRAVGPGDVDPEDQRQNQLDVPVAGNDDEAAAIEAAETLGIRVDPDDLEREAAALRDEAVDKAVPRRRPVTALGSRGLVGSHASLEVEDLIDETTVESDEIEAHEETYVPLAFARERVEQVLQEMRRVKEANLLAFAEAEDCHELMQREMRQQYEDYVESLKAKSLACIENYKRALQKSQKSLVDKETHFRNAQEALELRLHNLQVELDSRPTEPPTPETIHVPVLQVDPRLSVVVSNVEHILSARRADLLADYLALERSRAQVLKGIEASKTQDPSSTLAANNNAGDDGPEMEIESLDREIESLDRDIEALLQSARDTPGPLHPEKHELPVVSHEVKVDAPSREVPAGEERAPREAPPAAASEEALVDANRDDERVSEARRASDASVLADNRQEELETRLVAKIEEQERKIQQLQSKLAKLRAKGETENAEAIAKLTPKLQKREAYVATLQEQLGVFRNMRSPGDDDHDDAFPATVDSVAGSAAKHAQDVEPETDGMEQQPGETNTETEEDLQAVNLKEDKPSGDEAEEHEPPGREDDDDKMEEKRQDDDAAEVPASYEDDTQETQEDVPTEDSSQSRDSALPEAKEAYADFPTGDEALPADASAAQETEAASRPSDSLDASPQPSHGPANDKLVAQLKEQEAVIAKLTNELGKRVIKEKADDEKSSSGGGDAKGGAAKRYMEKLKAAEKKLKETEQQAKEAKNKANRLEQELDKLQKQGGGAGGGGRGGAGGDANSAKLKKELEDLKKKQKKQSDETEKAHAKAVRALEAKLKTSTEDASRKQEELDAATATVKALQEKAAAAELLEKENESLRLVATEADALRKSVESLNQERAELETMYNKEQKLRKEYWNMMEDMKGKIRVFARCRPMAQYELDRSCKQVVSFPDEYTLDVISNKGPKTFVYDRCFGPDSTQDSIFEDTQNLIQSSLDGYNVCVFAYGQTGSGKTFTMVGSQDHPGIVRRSVTEIFKVRDKLKKTNKLVVKLYVLEIYLDNLVDLLYSVLKKADASLVPAQPPRLDIKKDKKGTVFIKGAQVVTVDSAEELLDFFDRANGARKVASTKMNAGSSRSHLVFSLLLENTNLTSKKTSIGKLSLVDLAGSERQDKTGATDDRLKEAMSINKSLSALGDVISALSSGESFIPYRNNVLTQLMSDSLGGNAKTLMFVNISPADYNSEETVSSLTYASRVKLIKNNADKSQEDEQVNALKKIIRDMTKNGASPDPEVLKQFDLD